MTLTTLLLFLGALAHGQGPGATELFKQKIQAEVQWARQFTAQFDEKNFATTCPAAPKGSHYLCYLAKFQEAVKTRNPTETGLMLIFQRGVSVLADDARANGMGKDGRARVFPPWQQIWLSEWLATGLEDFLRLYEGLPTQPVDKEEQLLKQLRQTTIKSALASIYKGQEESLAKIRSRPEFASDKTGKFPKHLAEIERRMDAINKRMPAK